MSETEDYRAIARQMAEARGIDPDVYVRLINQESGFQPNVRSNKGALGLAQVMAETAQDPGYGVRPIKDRLDPVESLRFGADYLAAMLRKYDGDYTKALAAYNAGAGSVDEYGGVPPFEETQKYVAAILGAGGDESVAGGAGSDYLEEGDEGSSGSMGPIGAAIAAMTAPREGPAIQAPEIRRPRRTDPLSNFEGVASLYNFK